MKWSEKLGYQPDEKIVIIHADDAGITIETNRAIKDLFQNRIIQSCSVFANSPAVGHFIYNYNDNIPPLDAIKCPYVFFEISHRRRENIFYVRKSIFLRDFDHFSDQSSHKFPHAAALI